MLARQACRDFGRGSGSPARLNFGDCFAYALAADARQPLLFKGDEFGHTDVAAATLPLGDDQQSLIEERSLARTVARRPPTRAVVPRYSCKLPCTIASVLWSLSISPSRRAHRR